MMKPRLFKTALISSPILATYGIFPVYLFLPFTQDKILPAFAGLILSILAIWLLNIFLYLRIHPRIKRYILSYLITGAMVLLTQLLLQLKVNNDLSALIIYPLIELVAINTIILVIINKIEIQYGKERAESEIKNLKVINLEAEKQVLLQQLHPHFLFNALSTLKSLISECPAEAERYAIKLSDFLRYSVHSDTRGVVFLKEELHFVQDYIDLQKVRFGEALSCQITIMKTSLSRKVPSFSIQTLVENAIKHNSFTDKNPLVIEVEVFENSVVVSNNKLKKHLTPSSGTGLRNLNKRYQILGKEGIVINDSNDIFSVQLTLLADESNPN